MDELKKDKKSVNKKISLDFAAQARDAVMMQSASLGKFITYVGVGFFLLLLLWAGFTKVDRVTKAPGKVISSSKIQNIESLDGGVIEKIYVKKGEHVKKNEDLVEFENVRFAAEVKEVGVKVQALQATIARLKAEAYGNSRIEFPQELIESNPEITQQETTLFNQNLLTLSKTLEILNSNYALVNEQIGILEPLVQEKIISKIEFLQTQREANDIQQKIVETQEHFKEKSLTQLSQLNAELEVQHQIYKKLLDREEKTMIRSPVDGIVNEIYEYTVGSVISPGEKIMDIAPVNESLLIEARVIPNQVAFIHRGQPAKINITAYDFTVYGGIDGKVLEISPDTILDEEKKPYFQVTVQTNKGYIKTKEKDLPIMPGMTAEVNIVTGRQTVLQYLLKPILRARTGALNES